MKRWTYKDFETFKIHGEEHIHSVWCLDVEDNIEAGWNWQVWSGVPATPSDSVIHWRYAQDLVKLLYAWLYLLTWKDTAESQQRKVQSPGETKLKQASIQPLPVESGGQCLTNLPRSICGITHKVFPTRGSSPKSWCPGFSVRGWSHWYVALI